MREQNQLYDRLRESEESRTAGVKLFRERVLSKSPIEENYKKYHGGKISEYVQLIQAVYSNGRSLEFIKNLSHEAADVYIKADGNIRIGTIGNYNDHLYLFSLAVLFNFSAEKIGLMSQSWDNVNKPHEDLLIDTLISSKFPNRSISAKQIFPDVYLPVANAIKEASPKLRDEKIKNFVQYKWIDGHKSVDNASVNSHKNQSYMFFGYWSFETAALVKMFNISINNHDYGEYFPFSFFGLEEVPSQKHNSKTPKTKEIYPPKSPNYTLRVPEEWGVCESEKFTVSSLEREIKFSLSFYNCPEFSYLNKHFKKLIERKEDEFPWVKLREKPYTKSLPPRRSGTHYYHIAEYEGVSPDENKPLRYLLACEQIGKTIIEYFFVVQSKGFNKHLKNIRLVLGSVKINN